MATLKVTVHEARDVPVMDRATGLADLYVVVRLDDLEYTTDIVHMSRHPVWNKVFRLDTPDLLVLQEDPLEVRLYDHDIISLDGIVGHTFVDCNSMVLQPNPSMSGWFPLYDTSAPGIRGEVRLTVKIKFHTAENPLAPRLPKRYVHRFLAHVEPDMQRRDSRADDAAAPPGMSTSGFFPILQSVAGLEPLQATRLQHPSLIAEDEGILIFSVSRLDPSVYRVESLLTMVEELIVKADPEHSKLTNLRSTRSTNEARIVQLFKLSGKVRRQLARKVVEMQCNAVLGYVEEFDMEQSGIVVRAYGTPCVISAVKFVEHTSVDSILIAGTQLRSVAATPGTTKAPVEVTSNCASPFHAASNSPPLVPAISVDRPVSGLASCDETPNYTKVIAAQTRKEGVENPSVVAPQDSDKAEVAVLHTLTPTPWGSGVMPANRAQAQPTAVVPSSSFNGVVALESPAAAQGVGSRRTEGQERPAQGSRTNVLILTLKDLPSGMVEHIGGHICARSVKIVAKLKSKQMISQERDAWWMELREELKANARAFHCNVILAYEESALHYEDVAVLSLSGTAVKLNSAMLPLRGGPEFLYQCARERFAAKRNCSLLHLYQHGVRYRKDLAEELGDLIAHSVCNVCHSKPVPEFLLMSCAMPQDLTCEGQPRLVQVVVTRAKNAVRGVSLALTVSQALPFIEYSLHKQLLFNLRFQQLNAVFGLRVTIVITDGAIIGTLTGTVCRLTALPIPSFPRVEIIDPAIRRNEIVMRLKETVEQHHRCKLRQRRCRNTGGLARESCSVSHTSGTDSDNANESSPTWSASESDSDSVDEGSLSYIPGAASGRANTHISDYIVKIDDEEEAEIMFGAIGDQTFEDVLLLTIPYVPEWANAYGSQERVVLHRRFALQHGGSTTTSLINACFVEAKRAFIRIVCRVALRRNSTPPERLCVMGFRVDFFLEPNSEDLQLKLEGCLMTTTAAQLARLSELEDRSFRECMMCVEKDPRPVTVDDVPRGSACSADEAHMARTLDGSGASTIGATHAEKPLMYRNERNVFVMSNAPYSLPFVYRRDVPPPVLWSIDDHDATASAPPDVQDYCRASRSRHGMIGRQWQALTSLVSTSIRHVIERTSASSDRKGAGDGRRGDGYRELRSTALHQPLLRLPANVKEFEASEVGVIFTSLDFVAGQAITRYLGRLSQHFIREAYEIGKEKDLGQFFQETDFEIQCVVQSLVHLMGGNALLKHRVKYHEVWDSDGSGSAFVFLTVTGDVVQTTVEPIVPLSSTTVKDCEMGEDMCHVLTSRE